ncbi:response regulator [Coprobacter sp.]
MKTIKNPVILIAEDEECNYVLYEMILRKQYTLVHAWDGKEAVDLFKEYSPDLVLMDIRMPVMDGYEATCAIRNMSSSVPIIAITAYSLEENEMKMRECGCTDFLTKPLDRHLLKSKIASALEIR